MELFSSFLEIAQLTSVQLGFILFVVLAGAYVQASVGFGLSLLAVPFLAFVIPDRLPQVLLICGLPTFIVILLQERHHIEVKEFSVILAARILGVVPGVAVVAMLSLNALRVLFAAVIIAASIALLVRSTSIPLTGPSMVIAGLLSGVMATAASIGGPPIALLYSGRRGPEIRAGMSAVFLVGNILSVVGLALNDPLSRADLAISGALLLPVGVGIVVSMRTRQLVSRGRIRVVVIALSMLASVGLLVEVARSSLL